MWFSKIALAAFLVLCAVPVSAQTRFYFDSTAAAEVSPAIDVTNWTGSGTSSPVRLRLNSSKAGSAMASYSSPDTSTAPAFNLIAQFVKCGLAAQTIDGTIKGQATGDASNTSLNATLAVRVAKSDSAGNNVVEIVGVSATDLLGSGNPYTTTDTNRTMKNASESATIPLNSTGINQGDCLIVEVGFRDNSATTTRSADTWFGDDSATDLPENQTDTDTTKSPWIEFSDTILFGGGGTGCYRSMMGVGC